MRLTHIKLAGFKSFVDPDSHSGAGAAGRRRRPERLRQVQRHRRRALGAGRVVREASARRDHAGRHLQRRRASASPPTARASSSCSTTASAVPAGAWSKYAEISVKRVLGRDGESALLTSTIPHVRRKDVADIFLGTGLGGRAYAIIEQGMISRMSKPQPEELRVFLEEAAGISKYRDAPPRDRAPAPGHARKPRARRRYRAKSWPSRSSTCMRRPRSPPAITSSKRVSSSRSTCCGCCASRTRPISATPPHGEIEQLGIELEAETARLRELKSASSICAQAIIGARRGALPRRADLRGQRRDRASRAGARAPARQPRARRARTAELRAQSSRDQEQLAAAQASLSNGRASWTRARSG